MKKGILSIAALVILVLTINITTVYADETGYGYVTYEAYEAYEAYESYEYEAIYYPIEELYEEEEEAEEEPEIDWIVVRVPLHSDSDFFLRVSNEIDVNLRNNRNWIWMADPVHISWLAGQGFNPAFFFDIYAVIRSAPHLHYTMLRWGWDIGSFVNMDMPAIHFVTAPYTQIEFDFYAAVLHTISWGGDVQRNMVPSGDMVAPGSGITLPGGPSFTAIHLQGAYGPGRLVDTGNALILVEVLGEGNRQVPVYFLGEHENIPSAWAQSAVSRASELGLIPEFLDHSLRRPISRIDLSAFAVYLHEAITQREITGRVRFPDTRDVNAEKIAFLGVIQGDGDGIFNPSIAVPREQVAVILSRLASNLGMQLPVINRSFNDTNLISGWARDPVLQIVGAGIMTAPQGYFDPRGPVTREEVIVMMVRLFDMLNSH